MAAAERVKVALRVRPSFRDSAQEEVPSALEVDGTTVRPNDGAEQRSVYHFDHCVVGTPANEVHDAELSSRVKPLLDDLLKGYSASVLAYGQTGSGKTHAMLALTDEALRHIFALADEAKASSSSNEALSHSPLLKLEIPRIVRMRPSVLFECTCRAHSRAVSSIRSVRSFARQPAVDKKQA